MKILKNILAISTLILIASCSKSDDSTSNNPIPEASVYVMGTTFSNNIGVIKLNKDDAITTVSDPTKDSRGKSLFVQGTDVYIAGSQKGANNKLIATIWKNNVAIPITDGSADAILFDIFVKGSDVYTVGTLTNAQGKNNAMLWKNGVPTTLSTAESIAKAVFIDNLDVYVVGNIAEKATLWSGGIANNLTGSGNGGEALDVTVVFGDVYVVGNEKIPGQPAVGKIWKNQLASTLLSGNFNSDMNSIFTKGTDVYISGFEKGTNFSTSTAKIWKNNILTNLTNGTSAAYADQIFVHEDDVYALGTVNNYTDITLWKNGVPKILNNSNNFNVSNKVSLFVTNKL
jgi:hypothetical protein